MGNPNGNPKHGCRYTVEYETWKQIKARCLNPNNPRFADWGGRGITVCTRWRESFEAFLQDMGPRPSAEHSIDRIDNDSGYSPTNCRWATRLEQRQNRRPLPLGKSGRLGVTKTRGRWQARHTVNGQRITVGTYGSPEEASAALDAFKASLPIKG